MSSIDAVFRRADRIAMIFASGVRAGPAVPSQVSSHAFTQCSVTNDDGHLGPVDGPSASGRVEPVVGIIDFNQNV